VEILIQKILSATSVIGNQIAIKRESHRLLRMLQASVSFSLMLLAQEISWVS